MRLLSKRKLDENSCQLFVEYHYLYEASHRIKTRTSIIAEKIIFSRVTI